MATVIELDAERRAGRTVVRPGGYGAPRPASRPAPAPRAAMPAPLRLAVAAARESIRPQDAGADGKGRIRAIDGYRGLAAVMVIVLHATLAGRNLFSTTHLNVLHDFDICLPIFFVLSGMVAYMGVVRGAFGAGRIRGTRELIASRLWRILPVYYVVVLLVWSLRFAGTGNDWRDLALHLSFTQVWSTKMIFWLDGPSWFLADDMHFFLLVAVVGPLLAGLAVRLRSAPARLALVALFPAVVTGAGVAYVWAVNHGAHPATTQQLYNPLGKLDEFGAGMLLAVIVALPGVVKPRPRAGLLLTGVGIGGMAALGYVRWHSHFWSTWEFEFTAIGVMAMLAGAMMLSERQWLARILTVRPLQFLSVVGFTVFLVQEPVMLQLEQLNLLYFQDTVSWYLSTVAFVLSATVVAWLAYRLIEEPAMRLRGVLREMRDRQRAGLRRRRGPAPRRLPELVLEDLAGDLVPLRDLLGDLPLLIALGDEGEARLSEHAFRFAAGEAEAIAVRSGAGRRARGRVDRGGPFVLLDPDHRLASALGIPVVLLEVAPDGLITALHMPEDDEVGLPITPEASLSDGALAEHLHAQLTPDELRVVELVAGQGVSVRQAAATLALTEADVADLQSAAESKAIELTLAFHDDMICEPAALAEAGSDEERLSAVAEHVKRCRSCRVEFGDRVATVVRRAGELAVSTV